MFLFTPTFIFTFGQPKVRSSMCRSNSRVFPLLAASLAFIVYSMK